jgi:hypothetical protein
MSASTAPASAGCHARGGVAPEVGPPLQPLYGAAATSPCDVWAVGRFAGRALIEHWDGQSWKTVPSPTPSGAAPAADTQLNAVSATSPTNAWAVGRYNPASGPGGTLVEHWDGTAWTVQHEGVRSGFTGVATTSATEVWAVGDRGILHWDGTSWSQRVPPGPFGELVAVSAVSATDVWAVGYVESGESRTLIAHWNGHHWKAIRSPNPGVVADYLYGVSAVSPNDVWAVGYYVDHGPQRTLIEHWDGRSWKTVPSPNPVAGQLSYGNQLAAVSATSAHNAWAVGAGKAGPNQPTVDIAEHWDGTAWTAQRTPAAPGFGVLDAVAAVSDSDAWAFGLYGNLQHALIERFTAGAWRR